MFGILRAIKYILVVLVAKTRQKESLRMIQNDYKFILSRLDDIQAQINKIKAMVNRIDIQVYELWIERGQKNAKSSKECDISL